MTSIFSYFKNIQENGNAFWAEDNCSPVFLAKIVKNQKGRLIAITPYLEDGKIKLIYHFEIKNKVYNFKLTVENSKTDSITELFPNADWIEKEIWETYGIIFEGHQNLTHLLINSTLKTPLLEIEKQRNKNG